MAEKGVEEQVLAMERLLKVSSFPLRKIPRHFPYRGIFLNLREACFHLHHGIFCKF